jgi:thiol:disulfide interchange protein DsbD
MKIMKRYFVLSVFVLLSGFSFAQMGTIDDVIKWDFNVRYSDNCEADILMTVKQLDDWHIYSQNQPDGAVSLPTQFTFAPSGNYELIGNTKEIGAAFYNNGGIPEKSFHGPEAKFVQHIKIKSNKAFDIHMEYSYMACKESCFPPEFREKNIAVQACSNSSQPENSTPITSTETNTNIQSSQNATEQIAGVQPLQLKIDKAYPIGNKYTLAIELKLNENYLLFPFDNVSSSIQILGDGIAHSELTIEDAKKRTVLINSVNTDLLGGTMKAILSFSLKNPKDTVKLSNLSFKFKVYNLNDSSVSVLQQEATAKVSYSAQSEIGGGRSADSLWLVFLIAFGGGFLALITPCVFPMIPMTVSFFTKQSKTKKEGIRKGIIYAISIVLIYVVLGVIVSASFGSDALNAMSTNVYVNIAFFVLFVIFAVSFLGAFEIRLPNSWVNKADSNADKGGLIGIFFMAFTLALVSFSCTGPILGSILVQSATGGLLGPIVAMTGFSLALALPFGLFAAFPGWLNTMPQSGGWLNVVKVVLGLLELAFAFKFLSNADLVVQAHFLEREVFIAIWIAIFAVLAIYLFGFIRFPHDSPVERLSVGRALLATTTVAFVIYLLPGMWGAPLKGLSGFPPPVNYAESPYGIHGKAPENEGQPASAENVHGIWTLRNYDEALAWAKKQNKPLLLDFTGWACVNCRKMENNVWTDESVLPLLKEKFVVVSLYVDDRTALPKEEQKTLSNGKMIKTVGDRYAQMEIQRFGKITQPLYAIVDLNENSLVGEASYDTHGNPLLFKEWLESGLDAFGNKKSTQLLMPVFTKENHSTK